MKRLERARRLVAALVDPGTWIEVVRLVNHAWYDHVRERRRIRREPGVRISPTASFRNGARITLGAGCHIGDGCRLWAGDAKGRITVGTDALLAPGVFITASNYLTPAGEPVIGQPRDERDVRIGARTWLGANVVVLAGVHIGDGCVVGAGSVVTRSLPPEAIAVGVPARVTGQRAKAE
jgi:acetyltransferase-like isoleucine patch superfamily enzyme